MVIHYWGASTTLIIALFMYLSGEAVTIGLLGVFLQVAGGVSFCLRPGE